MNYYIIIRPLIGAGIGYVTNWIAVKMLFRPLTPIKVGKFILPFTPGIIPRNKDRIAESIGNSISENLLTEETLKSTLLSEEMKLTFQNKLLGILNSTKENEITSKELLCNYINEDSYYLFLKNIKEKLTKSIYGTIVDYDVGKIVAEQIEISAKEKIKGSILGIFGGNSIINSISETANVKVNNYIKKHGKDVIENMISSEITKYENTKISNIMTSIDSNTDLITFIMKLYENFIIEKMPNLLNTLNISKIVQDKINSMDMLELEKLILEIMKKELNALVNLGAIIGFLLGLLNLLF